MAAEASQSSDSFKSSTYPLTSPTPSDYQTLVMSFAQAVWETDAAGQVVTDSPNWRAYTGQTLDEWLGEGWVAAVHPDDRSYALQQWREAVRQQTPFNAEYRLRKADGGWNWTNVRATAIRDSTGAITKWLGINIDISDKEGLLKVAGQSQDPYRTQLEEELSQRTAQLQTNQQLLKATLDSSLDMIQVFEAVRDEQGQIIDFVWVLNNHTSESFYGDVSGQSLLTRNPGVVEAGIFETFKKVVETGLPDRSERHYVYEQFNGWFYQSTVKLGDGVATTTTDITQRFEAQTALRQAHERTIEILESTADAFYALDADFHFTYVNQRAAQLWGRDRDSLIGKHYWREFPLAVGSDSYHRHYQMQREGKPVHYETMSPLLGTWIDASIYPGSQGGLSVFFRDITERKRAEAALNESQERDRHLAEVLEERVLTRTQELARANQDLKRSNENLQQFAYVASHDLQEPLRKIQSFGDLLASQYRQELGVGANYLDRMLAAASRMSSLIKDLMTFSRISNRRDTSHPVSLTTVVQTVLTDLDLAITETGAVVEVDALPTVEGDRSQLEQLFQNLLSNALKFRQSGVAAHIQVRADQVMAEELPHGISPAGKVAAYHRIAVMDNGIGFDEKYLDRIFEVFQRLHGKSQYVGTGIGLAICEKVVANHGGAITAHSQPGRGATFEIYLPVQAPLQT